MSAGIKIRHGRRPKLRARCECEGSDQAPLWRYELLSGGHSLCVRNQQGLPTIGICDLRGTVDWLVAGVIGVAAGVQIPQLIRPVMVAECNHRGRGHIADSHWRRGIR